MEIIEITDLTAEVKNSLDRLTDKEKISEME